jgi:hypothetical protein
VSEKLPDDILWHQSGVNRQGEPFVQLILGTKVITQMDLEQARDHARAITEAAEAAEQDAFMLDFLQDKDKIGLDRDRAMQVLMDFRRFRTAHTGKRGGPADPKDWVMPPESNADPS